jgi:hypothetical protein
MGTSLILPNFRQPEKNRENDHRKRKWILTDLTKTEPATNSDKRKPTLKRRGNQTTRQK